MNPEYIKNKQISDNLMRRLGEFRREYVDNPDINFMISIIFVKAGAMLLDSTWDTYTIQFRNYPESGAKLTNEQMIEIYEKDKKRFNELCDKANKYFVANPGLSSSIISKVLGTLYAHLIHANIKYSAEEIAQNRRARCLYDLNITLFRFIYPEVTNELRQQIWEEIMEVSIEYQVSENVRNSIEWALNEIKRIIGIAIYNSSCYTVQFKEYLSYNAYDTLERNYQKLEYFSKKCTEAGINFKNNPALCSSVIGSFCARVMPVLLELRIQIRPSLEKFRKTGVIEDISIDLIHA